MAHPPTPPVRIAFGVLSSCSESAAAVKQLAALVAPHPVIVHHDFDKAPDFLLQAPNVRVLTDPESTAWADWSLVEATLRLCEAALRDPEITHFQLLSESCLPIRPVRELEVLLHEQQPDAMIDFVPLRREDVFTSHGWRYVSGSRFVQRVLSRATCWAAGEHPAGRPEAGLNFCVPQGTVFDLRCLVGRLVLRLARGVLAVQCRRYGLSLFAVGGQWFGLSRRGVECLLETRNTRPALWRHFRRVTVPDEAFVHTIVANCMAVDSTYRILPGSHALFWDSGDTGPDALSEELLPAAYGSGRFFARKFSLEPAVPLRLAVIDKVHS